MRVWGREIDSVLAIFFPERLSPAYGFVKLITSSIASAGRAVRQAGGTKPNLAKVSLARKIAAIVLAMWKAEEVYDPDKYRKPLSR